jgi:hypothetical protein
VLRSLTAIELALYGRVAGATPQLASMLNSACQFSSSWAQAGGILLVSTAGGPVCSASAEIEALGRKECAPSEGESSRRAAACVVRLILNLSPFTHFLDASRC